MRKSTKKIGDRAEDLAVDFLMASGYEIVARNWRNRFGEIDIIANYKGKLVFIEVKAKADDSFGTPLEMVTSKKLHKIIQTAQAYISENNYIGDWRVDAVSIMPNQIEIIKNITL